MNLHKIREAAGRHSSRRGALSAAITALAVAVVILVNLLAAQLPEHWTQFDLTAAFTTSPTPPGTTWRIWTRTW